MVVKDIERSLNIYEEVYGIGPWLCSKPGELVYQPGATYVDGKQVDFKVQSAVSPAIGVDGFTLELVQPLDGKSHYANYLAEHGDSMHHLVVQVEDEEEWTKSALQRGNKIVFEGNFTAHPEGQRVVCRQIDLRMELGFICEAITEPLFPPCLDYKVPFVKTPAFEKHSQRFNEIVQVCSVVEDIDKTVQNYEDLFGIGPWIYTGKDDFRFFEGKTFIKGQRVDFDARIASYHGLNIKLELVQPLDKKSHYAEFLQEDGQTLQHMKVIPAENNYFGMMKFLRSRYGDPMFEGWIGSKPFAKQYWCNYTDTREDLGFILELVFGPVPVV